VAQWGTKVIHWGFGNGCPFREGGEKLVSNPRQDLVLDALDEVSRVVDRNLARLKLVRRRIARIREQRLTGMNYSQIVQQSERPLVIELITTNLSELQRSGHTLRRAVSLALYEEGLTMEQIAELFGVSRQRVSELLCPERGGGGGGGGLAPRP